MNEKKKRKSQKSNKISNYEVIQKKVKTEEDIKQLEEFKFQKQIVDQFQQASCCIHLDNLCLISDLAVNKKIYQCSQHHHPGQYYCSQTYEQLLKQHGKYNLKCSLCSDRNGMSKIDVVNRKFLSQFLLKCKKCSQLINQQNFINHLIENINLSIESHQEYLLNFEKIDFQDFQHFQLFIQETSKIDMRNFNTKQIIAMLNAQVEKHLSNEGFQAFFSENELQQQYLGNTADYQKINCVQIKINKNLFIQLLKLQMIDKKQDKCKHCKNRGQNRIVRESDGFVISSDRSVSSDSISEIFSQNDSSSSSSSNSSSESSNSIPPLRRYRNSNSPQRNHSMEMEIRRRESMLERRIRRNNSSHRQLFSPILEGRNDSEFEHNYSPNNAQQANNDDVFNSHSSPEQINRSNNNLVQLNNENSADLSE